MWVFLSLARLLFAILLRESEQVIPGGVGGLDSQFCPHLRGLWVCINTPHPGLSPKSESIEVGGGDPYLRLFSQEKNPFSPENITQQIKVHAGKNRGGKVNIIEKSPAVD